MAVVKAGADFWKQARAWATDKKLVSPMEENILAIAAAIPSKVPTEKQSVVAISTLERLIEEGYPLGDEVVSAALS